MRFAIASGSIASLLAVSSLRAPTVRAIERVAVNDNRSAAGELRNGVLTIRLEAREAEWHPDRDSDPGIVIHAFAEEGKQALVPGPLIRVPEGTEIHAFVRNTLSRTLVMNGLSARGTARAEQDTVQVSPGAVRDVRFVAGAPGTYYYRGTIDGVTLGSPTTDAELNGAFVIDPRGASIGSRDRVFVIGFWEKRARNIVILGGDVTRFTINGKAWPNTERLTYDLDDTVRFRIVNPSTAPHPMHLHGFYFNVDSRGGAAVDSIYDRGSSPYRVVTERAAPGRTFTMTWVPERAGNWLFHCHDNYHVLRNAPLDGTPLPEEQMVHAENHALEMMGGLVMGVEVRGRSGPAIVAQGVPRRALRLVARVDANGGGTASEPSYRYVLQEGARSSSTNASAPSGPTILLKRGEPVSITVVNELAEPTAVHWHGIELESYFDGVAGFAGQGKRIAPVIAPRDSFEARFTPPRSGTFIYHPHADEVRQQKAGLSGALLVVDSPAAFNPANDIVLLLSVPRLEADRDQILINGSKTPPAIEMRVGERYRLRIVDIHTFRPSMIVRVVRDSTPMTWRAIAKDGMDIPSDRATTRSAVQQMGNGETYDFELAPVTPGDLQLMVSSGAGALLASIQIRVR